MEGVLSKGVLSGNGLCLEGVMYGGGFVRGGFVRGGFVRGGFVRRGFCPCTAKTVHVIIEREMVALSHKTPREKLHSVLGPVRVWSGLQRPQA